MLAVIGLILAYQFVETGSGVALFLSLFLLSGAGDGLVQLRKHS